MLLSTLAVKLSLLVAGFVYGRTMFVVMPKPYQDDTLLRPREAALELRISLPTIKQWIYAKKIRTVKTAGGHHRVPQIALPARAI